MEWMSYSLLVVVQLVANRYVAMAARNGYKEKEDKEQEKKEKWKEKEKWRRKKFLSNKIWRSNMKERQKLMK